MQKQNFITGDFELMREYEDILSCLFEESVSGKCDSLCDRNIVLYNFNCIKIVEMQGLYSDDDINSFVNLFNENYKDLTMKKHILNDKKKIYLYIIRRN